MPKYTDMQHYTFELPFGTQVLNTQLQSQLDPIVLEKVELEARKLANELHRSLNHRLLNSETRGFNDAPLLYPLPVSPEFWDFLQVCVTAVAESNYTLLPFANEHQLLTNIDDYIEIDPENLRIIKKQPITLDGSRLIHAYIVDQLHGFLETKDKVISSHAITTDRLRASTAKLHETTFFTPRMQTPVVVRSQLPIVYCAEILERDTPTNLAAAIVEAHEIWPAVSLGAQLAHATTLESLVALPKPGGLCTLVFTDGTTLQLD